MVQIMAKDSKNREVATDYREYGRLQRTPVEWSAATFCGKLKDLQNVDRKMNSKEVRATSLLYTGDLTPSILDEESSKSF